MVEKETFTLALQHHKKKSYKIAEDLYEELLKLSKFIIFLVGKERLELSQHCYHWILSPTRLPVPPFALYSYYNLQLIMFWISLIRN